MLKASVAFVMRHNPPGTSFSVFSGPQERVARTVVGAYGTAQIDGRWYGYFGGYSYTRDKSGVDLKNNNGYLVEELYKVDLETGQFTIAARSDGNTQDWLISPTGEIAARLNYTRATGAWEIKSSGFAGVELASGTAPTGEVSLGGYGRSQDTLLVRIVDGDQDVVREISLKDGKPIATYPEEEAGTPFYDSASRLWIGSRSPDDDVTVNLFDPRAQARLTGAVKAFPGYVARLSAHSADFKQLIMFTDGGDDSGTYWIVDVTKGVADPIGSPYPSIRPSMVGSTRWFDYKAADGLELRGVLTLPPGGGGKNLPLVVIPHGGPESHDSPGFDYWPQAFASRGYAVFQPNFRGSDGWGRRFRESGYGEWGRKMQTDISDGVGALAGQGVIDPKRTCIVGWSYGGYAALAGVTVQNGLYRCAMSYGGVADLDGMLVHIRERTGGQSAAVRAWKEMLGVTSTVRTDLDSISPSDMAARADAPVLLIHGKDDTVVPFAQSAKMARALRGVGKPVELIAMPGADHWLLQEASRVAMVKASVEFVMKHNPPDAAVAGP